MKNKIKLGLASLSFLIPAISSAQLLNKTTDIALSASNIVGILISIAFVLALLYFFYGVAKYVRAEGNGKEDGRQIMIWGVVALFVMSSVWGLVYFIRGEFGIGDEVAVPIPTIQP